MASMMATTASIYICIYFGYAQWQPRWIQYFLNSNREKERNGSNDGKQTTAMAASNYSNGDDPFLFYMYIGKEIITTFFFFPSLFFFKLSIYILVERNKNLFFFFFIFPHFIAFARPSSLFLQSSPPFKSFHDIVGVVVLIVGQHGWLCWSWADHTKTSASLYIYYRKNYCLPLVNFKYS